MKITEAREALANTFENIKEEANSKGIITEYKCFTADRDLIEVDINDTSAALIAGEITLSAEGTNEKIILECAVCINDGNIIDDELVSEITLIRNNIREFYSKIDELGDVVTALESIYKEEEAPAPEVKRYDNKMFYIIGGIVIAAVAVFMILMKVL